MRRRNRRWDPPLSGPCQHLGPSMSEMISDDEKAGKPLAPLVELTPCSPPLTISEMQPCPPDPPPPPFDREAALVGLQAAFALLTNEELLVARLRMLGVRLDEIGVELGMDDDEVVNMWKQARRKLGNAIFGKRQ